MPVYLIAYSTYRFTSELWRPEERDSIGLTFYQWSSIAIGFSFSLLLVARAVCQQRQPFCAIKAATARPIEQLTNENQLAMKAKPTVRDFENS